MAFYNFKKKPALTTKEGEKDILYASLVHSGTITTEQLIREIADRTSFSAGQIEGLLTELFNRTSHHIGEGFHVELGSFGYFSGKIKSRMVADKKEIRSHSVYFNGVNFRASKEFRMEAAGKLEHNPNMHFYSSRQQDVEILEKKLMDYLNQNSFITRSSYSRLTGRLKNTALKDLKSFVTQGLIECQGRGNQMHFIKATK